MDHACPCRFQDAIIWLLPKLTKAVPGSLIAIFVVSGIGIASNQMLPSEMAAENQTHVVMTVGDMLTTNANVAAAKSVASQVNPEQSDSQSSSGITSLGVTSLDPAQAIVISAAMSNIDPKETSISAGLPMLFFHTFSLPPITLTTLWIIFPFFVVLAAVGLIESLMTLTLIDEITETQGNSNRECLSQGFANIVCGMFGGMGGCAMIGQSLINVESGGRGRTSGSFCGLLFARVCNVLLSMD